MLLPLSLLHVDEVCRIVIAEKTAHPLKLVLFESIESCLEVIEYYGVPGKVSGTVAISEISAWASGLKLTSDT